MAPPAQSGRNEYHCLPVAPLLRGADGAARRPYPSRFPTANERNLPAGSRRSQRRHACNASVAGLEMPSLMSKLTDVRVVGTRLYFIAVRTRVPLKFGIEVTTSVTVARAGVRVADRRGRVAEGWGETPLSVQWVWPGGLPYEARHATLKDFSALLARA